MTDEGADWYRAIPVPHHVAVSYPRFVEWIRSRNEWHWGVAPLLDTPFNRAKSALKFFEYSALDLASICSDVSVYRDAVEPGETGILVANDPDSWRDVLDMALAETRRFGSACAATAGLSPATIQYPLARRKSNRSGHPWFPPRPPQEVRPSVTADRWAALYNVTPCRMLHTRQPPGAPPFTGSRDVVVAGAPAGYRSPPRLTS